MGKSVLRLTENEKPVIILLIGWGFIVFAVLMLLVGLGGLIQSAIIEQVIADQIDFTGMDSPSKDIPLLFQLILFSIRHMMVLSCMVIGIALSVIVVGFFFLKLKNWARITLEVFSWLLLVIVCIKGILFMSVWTGGPAAFNLFGMLVGLFITVSFAAIPVTAVVVLRLRQVKENFA